MKIAIEISSCKKCPNFKITDVSSTDGFDRGEDWYCSLAGRMICEFVEWHEKPEIPSWCPAALETILTDKEEEDFNSTVHA